MSDTSPDPRYFEDGYGFVRREFCGKCGEAIRWNAPVLCECPDSWRAQTDDVTAGSHADDGLRAMPHVFGYCARCQVSENDRRSGYCVVSPHGLAHQGVDGGMTACGHDATGPEWWWPL